MADSTVTQNHSLVKHRFTPTATGAILVTPPPAAVTYNRSARQYIVANGREIGRFPSGAENKIRAEWLALSYNDGRLYEAAQALVIAGHCERRTLRAAQIAFEGKVTERYHEGSYSRALVLASQGNSSPVTGQGFYHVYHNIVWSCDCEDHEGRRDAGERQPICKHILAVMLLERLEGEDEASRDTIFTRQVEHLQEREAARLQAAAAGCGQCHGRGTVYVADSWTGRVSLVKCNCQIDF
jgi:hypothetical protein